jgi:hypothetical protein
MVAGLVDASYGAPNTVDLGDGRAVRLKVEIDHDTNLFDDEFYGKFAFVTNRYNDYGHDTRPAGFTGNAEILRGRGDPIWWEPPEGLSINRQSPEWHNYRQEILELLEYGFIGLVAELLDGKDFYGKGVVRDMASLWGIEYNADDGYKREIIGDLLSELGVK